MEYQQLANVYDRLMDDAPYDDWLGFTVGIFQQSDKPIHHVADLGCGTGRITTGLAQMGYQMIGVDYSETMLSVAQQHASDMGVPVQWIHQDLRELQGLSELDAVVSYCDVMNYITTEEELMTVFSHVKNMLADGGIFIFDVHSLYHLDNNLAGETFAMVDDDLAYIWFCSPGEVSGEVFHDLTFFVQQGKTYTRFEEYHHQQTFPIKIYQKLLQASGFNIRHLYGDFSPKPESLKDNTERIFFVAEKQPGK
ncbi:class I SAM-dependent DNA methyltransferase [Lentibacillus daqui]|uniref:class I SAM-dependent DNA methyltransferase n=1 Tax=Lentibacillus daqui TaxID=2911514 RepID=UPI0022B1F25A|nr:class I SAM-dependent methyltransferase [Lentibacillus daqui]